MHRRLANAVYEFAAGVGTTTVDFRVSNAKEWLIELVSVQESSGIKLATRKIGNFWKLLLNSTHSQSDNRNEQKQSEEAEMITAQQRIGEKIYENGAPVKFPPPAGAIHMILVDMRGYLAGDSMDYRQIAYGPDGIPSNRKELIRYWNDAPTRGLFEKLADHPLRAAAYLQERIHMLGFIAEHEYRENEITEKTYWLRNPHLVTNGLYEEIQQTFPLCGKCA